MSALDWILTSAFFVLYITLVFTVCFMTFQKGHWLLGIIGIFMPILWLIGAILPAKEGSTYERQQSLRWQTQPTQMPSTP